MSEPQTLNVGDRVANLYRVASRALRPRQDLQEFLYHYTDAAGFHGILSSRRLRLTSILHLNDTTELQLGLDLMRQLASEQSLDPIVGAIDDLKSDQAVDHGGLVYVISFSEHADALQQWRSYCRPYGGYALGFESTELPDPKAPMLLTPVIYTSDEHRAVAQATVDALGDFLETTEPSPEQMHVLRVVLALIAPLIKHESFRGESEWRLISFDWPLTAVSFVPTPHGLRPFVERPLSGGGGSLRQVVVGPGPSIKRNVQSARMFVKRHELECEVRPSRVTLVDW